jgi:hypothetical protein
MTPSPQPGSWRDALKLGRVLGQHAAGEIRKEEAERRIDEIQQGTPDPIAGAATRPPAEFPGPPHTAAPVVDGAKTPKPASRRRWQHALSRTRGRSRS